jgi:hypothetical protein
MSTKENGTSTTFSQPPVRPFLETLQHSPTDLLLKRTSPGKNSEDERLQSLNNEIQSLREELDELEALEDANADWHLYERARLRYDIILFEDERSKLVSDHHFRAIRLLRIAMNAAAENRARQATPTQPCAKCKSRALKTKQAKRKLKKQLQNFFKPR